MVRIESQLLIGPPIKVLKMKFNCLENKNSIVKDVVIITAPLTDTSIPLMAPAVLKPIVEKARLSCLAVDLNAEIYSLVRNNSLKNDIIRFFFENYTNEETEDWIYELFQSIVKQVLSFKPKIVCISLFSYVCQHATKWISYYIKKFAPDVKIVIGGAGCLHTFTGASVFVDELLSSKLVDYHIRGDAEHSLYQLLIGNDNFLGINSLTWQEMSKEELEKLPIPDYSDYDFSFYEKKVLPLLGSRGCVRRCTFCDYIANWKTFQWRNADDIFDEIVKQHKQYNISSFLFQDSLTNGNQKEFRKLCELLSNYNKSAETKFKWSGYYIFREWSDASENDWRLIYESGAENLAVGIENLNEDIRYAIGKKFSNESIDKHIKKAKEYNIQLQLLNIVGYITETQSHIDFIKKWLEDHVSYKDILYIQWGGTLGIFPNTFLEKHKDALGITMIGSQPQSWINPTINSTPAIRAAWAKDLNKFSRDLGYKVANNIDNHYLLETLINA